MLSASSLDPLHLILSFALIDLPVVLAQPYFPKELVRIVHEYASEPCFVAELSSSTDSINRIELDSTSDFLRWLGGKLPLALDPMAAWEEQNEQWDEDDPPPMSAHLGENDSCLMDEHTRSLYGADISRLLHAQLRDNEYRACYLEIEPNEDGTPFKPSKSWAKRIDLSTHNRFCLDALNRRKAAIVARGQTPVAVGLSDLLEHVRFALQYNDLPHGLSPRLSDWAPLFSWIRGFEEELNNLRREMWAEEDGHGDDYPFVPQLHAVMTQLRYKESGNSPIVVTQACLWTCEKQPLLMRSATLMMIEDSEDEEADRQFAEGQEPAPVGSSSSSSSAAAASSSSASVSASWLPASAVAATADDESSARGAPRQRLS